MPSNSPRTSHRLNRYRWPLPRMNHNNRMSTVWAADRPYREGITVRWPNNVDHEHAARKTPSAKTAIDARGPTPAKAIPERPVAAAKRRPAPVISRRPHIPPGRPDPTPIAIGIEARVHRHCRLPHLPLSGNVVPASVGIQIRPTIALGSFEAVARHSSGGCFICRRLIAFFVPVVPRVLRNLLRQEVPARIERIGRQRLSTAHIRPISPNIVGTFHMSPARKHRNHSRRLVQIDPNRRIFNRRDTSAPSTFN